MIEIISPKEIEKRSFEIITERLKGRKLDPENESIIKRVIHTTADFDYVDNLYFSPDSVQIGIQAILNGCDIVTDTEMVKAGINKKTLANFGGEVHCFMSDTDVAEEALSRGVTRALVSMEKASRIQKPCIYAIGNAPTALFSLRSLIDSGKSNASMIIAVPVGFVNVVESKEMIIDSGYPCIVSKGQKGGSTVAAAICNALLYRITRN